MSKGILKIGIIGCGGIALAKHLPSLAKLGNIELTAFCDIIEEKAQGACAQFGTEGAKAYIDYKQLLQDETLDVIHVCTPNKSHAEISIAAMEAGKHVMCEKPMAKTAAEAQAMLEAARRTGRKLTIGYQNRFRPDSQYLKKACENGELGDVYFAKAHAIRRRAVPTWGVFLNKEEQGGGPLIDIGTHALDLTLWMMGKYKVKYVVGNTYYKLGKMKSPANAWGAWDTEKYDVEDSSFGFITLEDGSTIMLEASWALNTLQMGEARTTLCGTLGGADMQDGLRLNGERYGKFFTTVPGLDEAGVDFYDGNEESAADLEARLWIESIINDTEPVVKPEEAYAVTKILEAIYESSSTGKPVYFNE